MYTNYNLTKTLGPLAARLLVTLYERNRLVFHFSEAQEILGGRTCASNVLSQLIHNGVIIRFKSGIFGIIPFELGFEREYLGNPYILARELVLNGRKSIKQMYYLSYASAFDLHQMVTQPQLIVYISAPRMIRSQTIQGTEFHFVRCKTADFFGITDIWLDKNEKVQVSDLERTLLDGLKQPSYCGGLIEVAKGFSIKKQSINPQKLIDYAIQLGIGAVNRRLGYLMELYDIGVPTHWSFLQESLTKTYHLLDPELPSEGHHIAKWRLRLNISQEELFALRGT